eukprot:12907382-Heterocapsa_arctica.AAC.1
MAVSWPSYGRAAKLAALVAQQPSNYDVAALMRWREQKYCQDMGEGNDKYAEEALKDWLHLARAVVLGHYRGICATYGGTLKIRRTKRAKKWTHRRGRRAVLTAQCQKTAN